jgi:cell division protein FtsB
MTKTENTAVLTGAKQLLRNCCISLAVVMFFFTTGCSTTNGLFKKTGVDASSEDQAVKQKPKDQISQLQAREKELKRQIRSLNGQLKAEEVARDSLNRRLEIAQAAREDAIREVVRIRARIQDMASPAEASAMFAEARVILDRMEAEAFNEEALEQLDLAKSYMSQGKSALDSGNPGGGAYLFDLIPGLYEAMKKTDPRKVKIKVRIASLREAPAPSSPKISSLYWGESVTGLAKDKDWVKVKTSSDQTGWLLKSQVQ